jgi:CO dehydrogenase/acetyl-CoA synthase alpha subunit
MGKKKDVTSLAQALLLLRHCVVAEGNFAFAIHFAHDEDGIDLDS